MTAPAERRELIDIAVRTRFYCLAGRWLTDEERESFVDLVDFLIAGEIHRMADAAEKVSIVFDQDSDDGWRQWMRQHAAVIEAESSERKDAP